MQRYVLLLLIVSIFIIKEISLYELLANFSDPSRTAVTSQEKLFHKKFNY